MTERSEDFFLLSLAVSGRFAGCRQLFFLTHNFKRANYFFGPILWTIFSRKNHTPMLLNDRPLTLWSKKIESDSFSLAVINCSLTYHVPVRGFGCLLISLSAGGRWRSPSADRKRGVRHVNKHFSAASGVIYFFMHTWRYDPQYRYIYTKTESPAAHAHASLRFLLENWRSQVHPQLESIDC